MSRLQKKKDSTEKKRKRVVDGKTTDTTLPSSEPSSSKSAAKTGSLKSKPIKTAADVKVGEPNLIQKSMEFFREVKVELKKVTWPTRKQTTGTTVVVIIFVFVVSAFLGLFDLGLSKLVQVVLT